MFQCCEFRLFPIPALLKYPEYLIPVILKLTKKRRHGSHGGVASAFFWGIVGDVYGRRNTIAATLILNGAITLAQSTVHDYRLLLAARSMNGFLIGGPSTLVFTFLSDLVGAKRRQLYLNITGMSFVAAWLFLPAIAWMIIPLKVDFQTLLPIYSWRLYLALGSLPAFVGGFWFLCLPESPRLLSDTNRAGEAVKILQTIAKGNGVEDYKVKKLLQDDMFLAKSLNADGENRTKDLFVGVLKDLKMFVSKVYAVKSSLILFVFFANMAAGFGLNFWLPELLLRTQNRGCNSQPESMRLFDATNATWRDAHDLDLNNSAFDSPPPVECHADINDEVFTSGLIVGACCLLGNAACALIVGRGGAKGVRAAASACTFACVLACATLAVAACSCHSTNQVAVAAASLLNAASLNGNVLLIRLLLHALPAKLNGLGVCWGAWWGRAGGVLSNLAVGVLLDYSCPAPFIAVATLLAISIGAIMMIKIEESPTDDDTNKTDDSCAEKNTGLDRYISTYM
ncbi:major facilitator superfamily domain-containing protein [Phthorimaea operculella]|nr:major facilitator superfamily domain-containing protein [Phthorimaea operculella]